MKLKLHLAISNPEKFVRGDYNMTFVLLDHESYCDDWIDCGEIEFEIDVDTNQVVQVAAASINEEMGKLTAAMNICEQRKKELLAIGYDHD